MHILCFLNGKHSGPYGQRAKRPRRHSSDFAGQTCTHTHTHRALNGLFRMKWAKVVSCCRRVSSQAQSAAFFHWNTQWAALCWTMSQVLAQATFLPFKTSQSRELPNKNTTTTTTTTARRKTNKPTKWTPKKHLLLSAHDLMARWLLEWSAETTTTLEAVVYLHCVGQHCTQ